MAQISYIKYSDIDLKDRIDAEFFKPDYLQIDKKIRSKPYLLLADIAKLDASAFYPAATHLYKTGDVPFARCVDCINFPFVEKNRLSEFEKIPEDFIKRNKTVKKIKQHDLIITKVGTPCFASIVFDFEEIALSRTVLGVSKIKEINPFYLMIFLRSYFGFNQLQRQRELTIQYQLTLERVGKILIPNLTKDFQNNIELIAKNSHQKQSQSKQLYREAEKLLLSELGLLDYQVKHTLSFSTTKKAIEQAHRYDSEYFQPKYAEIIKKIEEYEGGWDFAGEMVKWKKGVEVGTEAYTETGKDFVRVSDFTVFGVSESNRKIADEAFEDLKKNFQPKQGEILFTKDGTIGISYVLKEDVQGVLSGAFLRLTLKEKYQNFEKECLSLIFSSILCKMQVEKLSGGALIAHLKPSDFETFKIPLIKPSIQKQIALKIQESHRLRKESKELLEEAKRRVEEEIEK